ncbi:cytosolic phospholipase A2 gamma-like [Gracilinanus agilis]|uniref:cytosolic phospholipase A2 gamma-like n=1 Tax=Gracilinanus agilis TaxID=191870 RepID=UPI001CFDE391|nr:cytosolic phospholipase A2 gamma-like [Gracilinanus agilis]
MDPLQEDAYGATNSTAAGDDDDDDSPKIIIHPGISDKEKESVDNRQKRILEVLQTSGIKTGKAPVVAVLGSGGGLRAAIACQGVLGELNCAGILDLTTYLAGVSGSTWCMSSLYARDNWQSHLVEAEEELKVRLQETSWNLDTALKGIWEAADQLEDYSLTDVWQYSLVYYMTKELLGSSLSQVRAQSEKGVVPYPIFAAIDNSLLSEWKEKKSLETWFEFTPHVAGYPLPGAYVRTTHFGSKFNGGKLIKKEKEKDFAYLRALWGSALADKETTQKTILHFFLTIFEKYGIRNYLTRILFAQYESRDEPDPESDKFLTMLSLDEKEKLNILEVLHEDHLDQSFPPGEKSTILTSDSENTFTQISMGDQLYSVGSLFFPFKTWTILKPFWTWTWGSTNNFLYQHEDLKDKPLEGMESKEKLHLMDAGLAINSPYPLVLPPVRDTQLILSFDFSEGDPFETIKATAEYCNAHDIPFPEVDVAKLNREAEAPSDFYIFEGKKGPVVMHFPLFNKVNCGSREDISKMANTYRTFQLGQYSQEDVHQLLELSKANVKNNKEKIMEKIYALAKEALQSDK